MTYRRMSGYGRSYDMGDLEVADPLMLAISQALDSGIDTFSAVRSARQDKADRETQAAERAAAKQQDAERWQYSVEQDRVNREDRLREREAARGDRLAERGIAPVPTPWGGTTFAKVAPTDDELAAVVKQRVQLDELRGRAKALRIPGAESMSPGELAQRVKMAETLWTQQHRPAREVDPDVAVNRDLLRQEKERRAKEAFADRMVQAQGGTIVHEKAWRPADLAEAKRLGMTITDYRAAEKRYQDRPNTARARAERTEARGQKLNKDDIIARMLAEDDEAPTRTATGEVVSGGAATEATLSDADLWERKVSEGMSPEQATAYVRKRKR